MNALFSELIHSAEPLSKSALKQKKLEDIVVCSAPFLLPLVPNPGNEPSSSKAFLQQQDAHLARMDYGSDDS